MSTPAPERRVRPPGAAADATLVFAGVMLLTGLLPSLPVLPTEVVSQVTRIGFEPLTDYARYAAAVLAAVAMYRLDCNRGFSACGRLIGEIPAQLTMPSPLRWALAALLLAAGAAAGIEAMLSADLARPVGRADSGRLAFVPLMGEAGAGARDAFLLQGAGRELLPAWVGARADAGHAVPWSRLAAALMTVLGVAGLAAAGVLGALLVDPRAGWLHALLGAAAVLACTGGLVTVTAADALLPWLLAATLGFLVARRTGAMEVARRTGAMDVARRTGAMEAARRRGGTRAARIAAFCVGLLLLLNLVHVYDRALQGLLLAGGAALGVTLMDPPARRLWWPPAGAGAAVGAALVLVMLGPADLLALAGQGLFWLRHGLAAWALPFGLEGSAPGMALTPEGALLVAQLGALLVALHALRGGGIGWMRVAGLVTGVLVVVCLLLLPGIAAHGVGLAGAFALTALALPLERRVRCWLALAVGVLLGWLLVKGLAGEDLTAVTVWLAHESRTHVPLHFLFWSAVHLAGVAALVRRARGAADAEQRRQMLALALLLAAALLQQRAALERSDAEHFLLGAVMSAPLLAALLPGLLLPPRVLAGEPVTRRLRRSRNPALVAVGVATAALLATGLLRQAPALATPDHALFTPAEVATAGHIRERLGAEDCFYSLTSQGYWYLLAGRPACSRFHHAAYARTPAAQAEVAEALAARRPPLLLFDSADHGQHLDGVSRFNTDALLVSRVIRDFRPHLLSGPHWLWAPADATPRRVATPPAPTRGLAGSVRNDIAIAVVLPGEQSRLDAASHALVLTAEPGGRALWAGRIDRSPLAAFVPTAALGAGEHRLALWLMDADGVLQPLGAVLACVAAADAPVPASCEPAADAAGSQAR